MEFKRNAALILLLLLSTAALAQETRKHEAAMLFGLNQPIVLKGFNVEVNYFTKKLSFDFSHGVSLNYQGGLITGEAKSQHLVAHLPFSTGIGIGYRFTEWINLRVEPKWHRFEIFYDGDAQTLANRVTAYETFTLGLGLYGKWHPFKNQNNFLKGIMVAPSVRWWPNVASTLPDDQVTYSNRITGQTETHHVLSIGVNNTPWLLNVSVGYRFAWE